MAIPSLLWGKRISLISLSTYILALQVSICIFQSMLTRWQSVRKSGWIGGQWTPASRAVYNLSDTVA